MLSIVFLVVQCCFETFFNFLALHAAMLTCFVSLFEEYVVVGGNIFTCVVASGVVSMCDKAVFKV